jgi:hypothetical protein
MSSDIDPSPSFNDQEEKILPDLQKVYQELQYLEGPLQNIFEYLDIQSLNNLSCSCRHFYEIINDNEFWIYLIKQHCNPSAITTVQNSEHSVKNLKKVYYFNRSNLIPPSNMDIVHMGDQYWRWHHCTDGHFNVCAKLHHVCWLMVTAKTTLKEGKWMARWAFSLTRNFYLEPLDFIIKNESTQSEVAKITVDSNQFEKLRSATDNIFYLPLGPFVVDGGGSSANITAQFYNLSGSWKNGITIYWLEFVKVK